MKLMNILIFNLRGKNHSLLITSLFQTPELQQPGQ